MQVNVCSKQHVGPTELYIVHWLVPHYPNIMLCLNNLFCNVRWLWKTRCRLTYSKFHPKPTNNVGYWNCAIGRLKLKFWNSEHLITDVINDARTKGRTQSICNTGINQVQQSDFIYSKSIIIRNSYKSACISGLQNFH